MRPHRGSSHKEAAELDDRVTTATRPGAGDAELEAFAAHAAHQLGEAVLLLAGNVDLLRAGAWGPGDFDDAVRGLRAGTERARRYVDDLLDVLAAGRETLEPVAVDLAAALGEARDELAEGFDRARARLAAPPMPPVAMDADLVARLCLHLLRGALAAARPQPLHITVTGREEAGRVSVEVHDDGEPVGEDASVDFFTAFAPPRGRGPLVGAGVSAVVCRRIVEAHGGTIEARAVSGGGAVVAFTLPRALSA